MNEEKSPKESLKENELNFDENISFTFGIDLEEKYNKLYSNFEVKERKHNFWDIMYSKSNNNNLMTNKYKKLKSLNQLLNYKDYQIINNSDFSFENKNDIKLKNNKNNNLIKQKKLSREDIGLLVFGAHSTDYHRPATACVLHKRLGLSKNCVAFDVSLGCSAFVYTAQIAASMMVNSDIQKAIVIVGETVSKLANPKDRSVSMLFGDAGCAVLLEKKKSKMSGSLYTDGTGFKAIIAPAGGFRNLNAPQTEFDFPDGVKRNLYNVWMNGTDVFTFTISDILIPFFIIIHHVRKSK